MGFIPVDGKARYTSSRLRRPDLTPLNLIKVDPNILAFATEAFATPLRATADGPPFAADFGSCALQKDIAILDMPEQNLIDAWQECVKFAMPVKIRVEDEISKSRRAHVCPRQP
jgi:hypothetical protein